MFKKIASITAGVLILTGCASTPTPEPTLYGGAPAPQTESEVIDLVAERYGQCFDDLGGAKYAYAPDGEELLPGSFLATGEGWTVLINVSPITDKGVLPTVVGSDKSAENLATVGC